MAKTVGIGIIGFGGFGMFAAQQFAQIPGITLRAIASTNREGAMKAAQLLAPRAGKHVIVEKPLSLTNQEADELVTLAREKKLLMTTNLMQRYNPLYAQTSQLVKSQLLGNVLHGYFENYACDEGLGPEHWFWKREQSGGIFIEHGVHFFDMFAGWLGEGRIESASRVLRPGSGVEEQVYCTGRYGDVPVNFYHGFTQAGRMDRQEMRLLFERGDVTLHEWVPTKAVIRAALDEASTRSLCEIFPHARVDVETLYAGGERSLSARHKKYEAYQKITLTSAPSIKMTLYGDLLRYMLTDQISYLTDRSHSRVIDETNGRESLRMSVEASRLALS